ncbi:MAG: hypothetical protein M1836_004191 [Candelina mexicana]|nr:MAG: hypothetical protein M1836_004191 [Candelina mexicana]
MVADTVYELCLPILQDLNLEEEDTTEKLEELLRDETSLDGTSLENAILDILWRFRDSTTPAPPSSPAPVRHTTVKKASPAPWQIPRASTPGPSSVTGASPKGPSSLMARPAFPRAKSYGASPFPSASAPSPFTSPKASPHLTFSKLQIPHSPSLNAYKFSDVSTPAPDIYGDYGSDTVDWLVNDDAEVDTSPTGVEQGTERGLSGAATAWAPQQAEMSPYDMLRSVLGGARSDEEIGASLQMNGYDLSATLMALMEGQPLDSRQAQTSMFEQEGTVLVGKSMTPDPPRTLTPQAQGRSSIVCKYWLSTGSCLRADCRFSHDLSSHICKYWVMGNCLAGDTCIFSHDPANLVDRLSMDDAAATGGSQQMQDLQANFQLHDLSTFPALQSLQHQMLSDHWSTIYHNPVDGYTYPNIYQTASLASPPPGFQNATPYSSNMPQGNRPGRTSEGQSREALPSVPPVDDTEAFPSLGSSNIKGGKKHHGKRGGHGHSKENKEPAPSSMADIVRMSPSPAPAALKKGLKTRTSYNGNRENSAAAQAIPPPQHIPWLETGERANKLYLTARQEAIKHGGLRNKFLQSAAQAWNRNDARAAKALSLRGQSENDLMRKAHREAARQLYEERNKNGASTGELYVDLHGLHPEEATSYLERILLEQQTSLAPIYAITGTGHHSKNGKDKVGKAVRGFLNEWRYAYREFSVPGDRGNVGGILGIDPKSFDRGLADRATLEEGDEGEIDGGGGGGGGSTKVRVVRDGRGKGKDKNKGYDGHS